jgi:hypothetical protein
MAPVPSNFNAEKLRRRYAAETYANESWATIRHGELVGELPPRIPGAGLFEAWVERKKVEYEKVQEYSQLVKRARAEALEKKEAAAQVSDQEMIDADALADTPAATDKVSDSPVYDPLAKIPDTPSSKGRTGTHNKTEDMDSESDAEAAKKSPRAFVKRVKRRHQTLLGGDHGNYWYCASEQLRMVLDDLDNPHTFLNKEKREKPWRVIKLGESGMDNLVKVRSADGGNTWKRALRVVKAPRMAEPRKTT